MTALTVIDLFCGAGGLSEGFRQAGFTVVAGNDFNDFAADTYRNTHPDSVFLPGPIEDLKAQDFLKAASISRGELDCLVGGPPCQAFSVYNHQRGLHDKRSSLFKEYLRIVKGLWPKWVVMENVTGITSVGNGRAVKDIFKGLQSLGYHVESNVLKAEEFGIPQERRRIFFIGNRLGLPIIWPDITHGKGQGLKKFVTVGQAISDLPALGNGEGEEEIAYLSKALTAFQREMRKGSKKVFNHVAPKLAPINLKRMQHIPQGGSWRDIPFDLLPAGMKKARRCDHTKRYGRLHPDGLACTILTKCDIHWGSFIHPDQDRTITVREAARLQSFPDWFKFLGPKTEQYVQVGNAVPPLLAKQVAQSIITQGFKEHSGSEASSEEDQRIAVAN